MSLSTGLDVSIMYYDKRVSEAPTRAAGSPLKSFHNAAKRELLVRFAGPSLLDLACGRGGDIHKWRAAGVGRALGLDASAASVDEACQRFEATGGDEKYTFETRDLRHAFDSPSTRHAFDTVTCMFALQYFFGTEASARAVFETVASSLAPGGHFVGIVPDATHVVEVLRANGGKVDDGVASMRALWDGPTRTFGSEYAFGVAGTIVDASNVEFLVFKNVVTALARAHGLEPVDIHGGGCFTPDGPGWAWLAPPYGGAEGSCTRMYKAFAFVKV